MFAVWLPMVLKPQSDPLSDPLLPRRGDPLAGLQALPVESFGAVRAIGPDTVCGQGSVELSVG